MRALLFVFALAATVASCAPTGDIGEACAHSSDCAANRVCLPLDPKHSTAGAACLPMPAVQPPVPCNGVDNGECIAHGFPIDSSCDNVVCTGAGVGACCVCNDITCDGELTVDPTTCTCTNKPPSGVF